MDAKQLVNRGFIVGVIGAMALTTGGLGIATAVNGGSLVLGHANTATHTTTLKDAKGTPLSLSGKKTAPPLKVNSKVLVKNFNAGEIGGLSAKQLSSGSSAQFKINVLASPPTEIVLPQATGTFPHDTLFPVAIVQTARLVAGSYAVTGTALAATAVCWLGTSSAMGVQQYGSSPGSSAASLALTEVMTVTRHQRIHLYCAGTGNGPGGSVNSAGITAIKLAAATAGTAHAPTPQS